MLPEFPPRGGHQGRSRGLVSWNLPRDARKQVLLAVQIRKLGLMDLMSQLGSIAGNCPSPDLTRGLSDALPLCCPGTVPNSPFLHSSWPQESDFPWPKAPELQTWVFVYLRIRPFLGAIRGYRLKKEEGW